MGGKNDILNNITFSVEVASRLKRAYSTGKMPYYVQLLKLLKKQARENAAVATGTCDGPYSEKVK